MANDLIHVAENNSYPTRMSIQTVVFHKPTNYVVLHKSKSSILLTQHRSEPPPLQLPSLRHALLLEYSLAYPLLHTSCAVEPSVTRTIVIPGPFREDGTPPSATGPHAGG